jgi:hypothetical protein
MYVKTLSIAQNMLKKLFSQYQWLIKDIDPKEPFSCTVQEDTAVWLLLHVGFRNFKEMKVGLTIATKQNLNWFCMSNKNFITTVVE